MTTSYLRILNSHKLFSGNIFRSLLAAITAGVLFITSCEEDPTTIGTKMLPSSDFVNIFSTDSIRVRSVLRYSDSVKSANPSTSYMGAITDPYFGRSTAGFVSQLRLGDSWGQGLYTVDSVKLYMKLLTVRGAVSKPHYLKLSEISKQIYTDSSYYSSLPVPLTEFSWSDIPLPALKADTVNEIEIDIPAAFGTHLIRDTVMLFHSNSKPDFRSYFKGLHFQITSPEEPVFVSLSIDPPGTYETYSNYFVLFMHDRFSAPVQFFFIIDAVSRNAAFNTYVHDFEDADPLKKIMHVNEDFHDTVAYVQKMNGIFTKITIPALEQFKNDPLMKNISVNKARLILPVVYDNDIYKPSTLPSQIFLRYVTTSGDKYIVPDYYIGSSVFYDGRADTTANIYKINIATYVQSYLEDQTNTLTPELELYLLPSSENNVILRANGSANPIKFEFTYTRF